MFKKDSFYQTFIKESQIVHDKLKNSIQSLSMYIFNIIKLQLGIYRNEVGSSVGKIEYKITPSQLHPKGKYKYWEKLN